MVKDADNVKDCIDSNTELWVGRKKDLQKIHKIRLKTQYKIKLINI